MSQRAITARIRISSESERAALWRTHRIFNDSLRWVVRQVHRMKRGDPDPRYAEIFESIKTVNDASARLEAVTSLDWNSEKKDRWRELARELIAEGKLLFDRELALPCVSSKFRRRLFEAAFQAIHGHYELVKIWKKEHAEWIAAREKWEQENHKYMAIRPALEAFEAEHGQAAKRRQRWHKWLAFLRSRPDLAAWRGGPAAIHEEDAAAKRRIEKARRSKRDRVRSDEFFEANPELKELNAKHGYYQREFVRPWAKRRHPDGFRHRPTFTEPSAEGHPSWFQFMRDQGYKGLDLDTCSLQLQLLSDGESEGAGAWQRLHFRPDPRLLRVKKATEPGKSTYTWTFSDPALGIDRPAEIRGAKLIFRPARPEGDVYLYFTLDVPDLPCRIKTTQEWCDKYGTEKLCKKICDDLGAAPVSCAIDLGIRNLAAATIRREGKIVKARMIREDDQRGAGPQLSAIAAHKRTLAAKRRERGKPVAGEESCIELQKHVTNMGEDRFKKGARRIVNFARENGCDLIIMENLAGLIPDAEKERGINKALAEWNRGNLAIWIKRLAVDAGMRVAEADVPPKIQE